MALMVLNWIVFLGLLVILLFVCDPKDRTPLSTLGVWWHRVLFAKGWPKWLVILILFAEGFACGGGLVFFIACLLPDRPFFLKVAGVLGIGGMMGFGFAFAALSYFRNGECAIRNKWTRLASLAVPVFVLLMTCMGSSGDTILISDAVWGLV